MKPIVPGCLAMIIAGEFAGKTVRCDSGYYAGEMVRTPDGGKHKYTPMTDHNERGWLCIGNIIAKIESEGEKHTFPGYGMIRESKLLRIDSEGDDELIEEFAMEECANVMEEQMKKEGIRRLW